MRKHFEIADSNRMKNSEDTKGGKDDPDRTNNQEPNKVGLEIFRIKVICQTEVARIVVAVAEARRMRRRIYDRIGRLRTPGASMAIVVRSVAQAFEMTKRAHWRIRDAMETNGANEPDVVAAPKDTLFCLSWRRPLNPRGSRVLKRLLGFLCLQKPIGPPPFTQHYEYTLYKSIKKKLRAPGRSTCVILGLGELRNADNFRSFLKGQPLMEDYDRVSYMDTFLGIFYISL